MLRTWPKIMSSGFGIGFGWSVKLMMSSAGYITAGQLWASVFGQCSTWALTIDYTHIYIRNACVVYAVNSIRFDRDWRSIASFCVPVGRYRRHAVEKTEGWGKKKTWRKLPVKFGLNFCKSSHGPKKLLMSSANRKVYLNALDLDRPEGNLPLRLEFQLQASG